MHRTELIEAIFASMQSLHRNGISKFHALIGQHDITPSQLELLFVVQAQPVINVKDLAAKMQLTPGGITQLVEGLVQNGYVHREQAPNDRRVTNIIISREGSQKLADLQLHRLNIMRKIMQSLTTEELQVMLRVQEKMLEHIGRAAANAKKEQQEKKAP